MLFIILSVLLVMIIMRYENTSFSRCLLTDYLICLALNPGLHEKIGVSISVSGIRQPTKLDIEVTLTLGVSGNKVYMKVDLETLGCSLIAA
jgi:hypothetical protein